MANIQTFQNASPGSYQNAPGLILYTAPKKKQPEAPKLDKLEQLTQTSPINGLRSLTKRARAKFVQYNWLKELSKLDSPLHKNYTFALRCSSVIKQEGDKFTSRYCGNRFCLICNRIRTGKLINAYQQPLDQLQDKQFVTLTRPNVPAEDLHQEVQTYYIRWRAIMKRAAKQGHKFNGIRKLEITYNPARNDFHPHFHLIVEGKENAEWIVNNWLFDNPESTITAQDIRPCTEYLELFKYVTKLTSKTGKNGKPMFYPQATDVIFTAIKGARIFQPFGELRKVKVTEDVQPNEALTIKGEHETDQYSWSGNDWYSNTTGEALTEFEPSEALIQYSSTIAPPTNRKLSRYKPPD